MKRPVEICGKVPEAMDAISPGRAWPGVDPDSVAVTQNEVRACSACSGDYEDPDRTAPGEQPEEELPPEQRQNGPQKANSNEYIVATPSGSRRPNSNG